MKAKKATEPELRVGIIGCGNIARAHVRAYASVGGNRIVAVCDAAPDAASALAESTGAAVMRSAVEMATRGDIDAVSVCTPPAAHFDACVPFLDAGIAVLCEKPLGVDERDAERLAVAARGSNAVFMTAFCHRFHPPIVKVKNMIDSGTLGKVLLFRNIFAGLADLAGNHRLDPKMSGGGPLIDHCSHSFDLFRFLVGEPTAVRAMAGNVLQELPIEDFGMIHLSVDNCSFGEITGSYSLPASDSCVEIYGSEGVAKVGYGGAGQPDLSYRLKGSPEWTLVDMSDRPDRFSGEIAHFLSCVRTGATPAVTAEDGLSASRIVAAAYKSLHDK